LRKYQIKAIEDIRHHFSRGKKRILLVAPTGSGKTVISSSMMGDSSIICRAFLKEISAL